MSTTTPHDYQSIALDSDLDADSAVADAINALAEEVSDLREEVADLREENEQLRDRVTQLEEQSARDRADIKSRVSDVEEAVSDEETPTLNDEETPFHEPETGLEDVVQLPEPVAEDTLTANQQRARFVARDLVDYTRSVPAGRAIKSSEIRRVLTAAEGGSVHSQTVSRVMEFLDQLGEDAVQVRESRSGERLVVFDEDLVKRIVAYSNSVVTEDRPETPRTV